MKPIFEEEKLFFEKKTGIKIPNNCWRNGTKIYLNSSNKELLIRFKIEDNIIKIVKNNIYKFEKNIVAVRDKKQVKVLHNYTLEEEISLNKNRLIFLENRSVSKSLKFIKKYRYHEKRLAHSGGKDSDVLFYIFVNKILPLLKNKDYKIDFNNTTNDTAQTYLHIKELPNDKLNIHNPQKGIIEWITEDKNYFLPCVTNRNCCSNYKEGRMKDYLDKDKKYLLILGMRRDESPDRSKYDYDLNKSMGEKNNVPENWKRFLPILEWTDIDIWLYILMNNIKVNHMYKLGYNRCGCLICPFQSDYIDLLTQYFYPFQWSRWMKIVEKNYEVCSVGSNLKWSLKEWLEGRWKQGKSQIYEITKLKMTKERIQKVMKLLGISEELAKKYFKKECFCCGKKLNPEEIGMSLKVAGQEKGFSNVADEDYLCKKCYCDKYNIDKKTFKNKVFKYRKDKCSLF